jgi:hypothetical protein
VSLFPFTPLPGAPAAADGTGGIYSFTEADQTDPAVMAQALSDQLVRTHALGSFANPATQLDADLAAAQQTMEVRACPSSSG